MYGIWENACIKCRVQVCVYMCVCVCWGGDILVVYTLYYKFYKALF